MSEFDLSGIRYRTKLLCAFDQWHLLNRMRPILPALSSLDLSQAWGVDIRAITAALAPLSATSDEDMLAAFRLALTAVQKRKGKVWMPVDPVPGMADLMRLVTVVFAENLGPLFAMDRVSFTPIQSDGVSFKPVSMPHDNDWLFRPILSKPALCSLKELKDGTYRIEDVALMHDALAVMDENNARARKISEKR